MKIISVNVAEPAVVKWRGEDVTTSIVKKPVTRRLSVVHDNIEGDIQADLSVHGGKLKAVYAYAAEHYAFWRNELQRNDLDPGMFGENLTVEGGLLEDDVFVGDLFRAGTSVLMAVQPRMPCYKLGIRFGTQQILKRFTKSRRYGVYFRIMEEGTVAAGDTMERLEKMDHGISIRDIGRIIMEGTDDPDLVRRALALDEIPPNFKNYFRTLLERE